ncbi:hypothetical protein [Roseivivax sp. CAU 1761]
MTSLSVLAGKLSRRRRGRDRAAEGEAGPGGGFGAAFLAVPVALVAAPALVVWLDLSWLWLLPLYSAVGVLAFAVVALLAGRRR